MKNKKITIGIVVGAILIAGGGFGYYAYNDYQTTQGPRSIYGEASPEQPQSETTGNVVITPEEIQSPATSLPDLKRAVNIPAYFPEDAKKIITDKIAKSVAALTKNPTQFGEWLNLGIYRKTIDDYEGARIIWEFLVKTNPTDSTAYINLANIYGYYLKDIKKAEVNYLKAIELNPAQAGFYRSAADFYRDVMKDNAKARSMLQQGIDKNPSTSQDLKAILPNY
jgi:tetratricopeptide (TPR) repeat protein